MLGKLQERDRNGNGIGIMEIKYFMLQEQQYFTVPCSCENICFSLFQMNQEFRKSTVNQYYYGCRVNNFRYQSQAKIWVKISHFLDSCIVMESSFEREPSNCVVFSNMRLNSCVIFPLLKRTVRETRQGIPLGQPITWTSIFPIKAATIPVNEIAKKAIVLHEGHVFIS